MSTNYYVDEPVCTCPCPHCSAPEHPHIGKFSGGWEFSFSAVHGPKSWKEWKEYLKGKSVVDEYGQGLSTEKFIQLVEASRRPGNKNHAGTVGSLREDYLDSEGWSFSNYEFD